MITSPGGRYPVDIRIQTGAEFRKLLEKVAEKFNGQFKLDVPYSVDKVQNVMKQVSMCLLTAVSWVVTWIPSCKLVFNFISN